MENTFKNECFCEDWTSLDDDELIAKGNWVNVSGTHCTIVRCKKCNTIRTKYCTYEPYEEGVYIGAIHNSMRHINSINTITKYCSGKLLDIGCNAGELINELRITNKFKVLHGIDNNQSAILLGKKEFALVREGLYNKQIDDVSEYYDCIVMNHVFEHIENPVEFLRKIETLLDANGEKTVYLCVPNINSTNDVLSFGALDPREHYWHFTEKTLISLVKRALPNARIIFSGLSHIWGNNEQIELVFKLEK